MKTYVVEKAAILYNLDRILKKAGQTPVWAVLKNNGYGLGVTPMAELCMEKGINRFAVTDLSEAAAIRNLSDSAQILMLRPTMDREELQKMLEMDVIATISSTEHAAVLNGLAAQFGLVAEVQIKIDTGMGRYGFLPQEQEKILDIYRCHDHLAVSGIYTHFANAFGRASKTHRQAENFKIVLNAIQMAGFESGLPHCCNSHAFFRFPDLHMQGVRVGSALLGRLYIRSDLRKVGICETAVDEVRWLPAGHTTGYGSTWRAKKPTKIAVVPVGTFHGFSCIVGEDTWRFRDCVRRMLSAVKCMIFKKKLYVYINGKKCRVLGHVGSQHTVCDVTDVPCQAGDKATMEISPLLVKGMKIEFR